MRTMKTILLVVAALLIAASAHAQDAPAHAAPHSSIKDAAIVYALVASMDSLTTWQGQRDHVLTEVNPMYAHMSPGASVVVGAAVDALTIVGAARLSRSKPKLAKAVLWTLTAARLYATAKTVGTLSAAR